jgi:hypothetical protein
MSTREAPRRRMLGVFIGLLALVTVGLPGPVLADPGPSAVRTWNENAMNALLASNQPPPVSLIHMGMVQGAVYDAVNSIVGGYEPYNDGIPAAAPNSSLDAAVATAARDVLVDPTLRLTDTARANVESAYTTYMATIPDDPGPGGPKANGTQAGANAARAMLDVRASDNRYGTFRFTPRFGVGQWRPTPAGNDPNAWVAEVVPFTLTSPSQFPSAGPFALTSAEYAKEFNEVKAVGSATSTKRTPAQTDMGRFYLANPVPMWNATFRRVAEAKGLTLAQEARLFAMLDITGADTIISCWDDKKRWSFWRPSTAIAEAASDGNPATQPEAGWNTLFKSPTSPEQNPPYPEHPSGYNCVTGGIMHAARRFFGTDRVAFTAESNTPGLVQPIRSYVRFTDAYKDTIDARVYLGIHFRRADVASVIMGRRVATWVANHAFQPTD